MPPTPKHPKARSLTPDGGGSSALEDLILRAFWRSRPSPASRPRLRLVTPFDGLWPANDVHAGDCP